MRFELFVALRYLLARRQQTFISVISLISVLGVALGVAALIVVLGVMNGFSTDLREKILGVNAHLVVGHVQGSFGDYRDMAAEISDLPDIKGVMPFLYSEVMVSSPRGVKGSVLRGIDPTAAQGVLSLKENMVQGSVEALTEARDFPGVLIGKEMALRLGLTVDSTLNLLSPSGSKSAAGFSPEVRTAEVVGIFDTGMFEYDSSLAYVDLKTAQDLLGFSGDKVNGLEVRLGDVYAAKKVADAVEERLGGYPFYARDWMEMNENLFSALQLEKTAMFVILVMIVLVGSFSIITTLVMLVMEKTRDIAILISMGARPENIKRIFMLQGTIIGAVGTSLGYVLGLGISMLLKRYQFIELPKDVYYLDRLPVRLEWLDMSLIGIAAMALCFLATLYPASQAANLQPAEALRYE